LTNPNIREEPEIVEIASAQVNHFMAYVSQEEDCPGIETSGLPLPFTAGIKEARKLKIDDAISENIYRDQGQLSQQREEYAQFKKYRKLGWGPDGTRGCVYIRPNPPKDPE
jgi:hypothetical protein